VISMAEGHHCYGLIGRRKSHVTCDLSHLPCLIIVVVVVLRLLFVLFLLLVLLVLFLVLVVL